MKRGFRREIKIEKSESLKNGSKGLGLKNSSERPRLKDGKSRGYIGLKTAKAADT